MELSMDDVLNVGTGIPNDVVGPIIAEEGIDDDVTVTVESGIYGGIPMGGIDFGIAKNNFALVRHDDQFDYYNGAGVDVTYMGAARSIRKETSTRQNSVLSPPEQAASSISRPTPNTLSSAPLSPGRDWSAVSRATGCISYTKEA